MKRIFLFIFVMAMVTGLANNVTAEQNTADAWTTVEQMRKEALSSLPSYDRKADEEPMDMMKTLEVGGKKYEVIDEQARNDIKELDESVNSLSEEIAAQNAPNYVITEANSVIDKIAAAQGNRTFTLAAITDLHYGNGSYTDGVKHATQALKYIDERIKLDAVAVLGDFTDGFTGREGQYANAIADFRAVNAVLNGLRFGPNLRIHGNHDFYEGHMQEILRYTNAYSDDVVWGSSAGDYFYRDFSNQKLRIVCLNTVANDGGYVGYTDEQAQWFADTLNLSNKDDAADWHILILSHQPVDYPHASGYQYKLASIIDAYVKGTSYTNGSVTCDYAGKNAATLVGNIHGHIHNLLVDRIYVGATSAGVQTDALRIATPEACYGRPNGYSGVWHEETTYDKTKNSADDTSFVVYCIDLDTNTIKAVCYGSGYDRTITYGDTLSWEGDTENGGDEGGTDEPVNYTNWIPIATDESGSVVTGGAMYTNKRWNSKGEVVDADGLFITGFIPVKIGDYIRVRWDNTEDIDTGYTAFRPFDVNKNSLSDRMPFLQTENPTSNWGIAVKNSIGYQYSHDNGIFDFTLPVDSQIPESTAYIAFILSGSPSKAIVTVNEPID